MIRRRKFQAKPMLMNKSKVEVSDVLTPTAQPEAQPPALEFSPEPVDVPPLESVNTANDVQLPQPSIPSIDEPAKPKASVEIAPPIIAKRCSPIRSPDVVAVKVPLPTRIPAVIISPPRPVPIFDSRPASVAPTDASSNFDLMSPSRKIIIDEDEDLDVESVHSLPPSRPTDATAGMPTTSLANVEDAKMAKKRRISALRHEEVIDPKRFTLADLVDWRPRTENTLRKKWAAKRQRALEKESENSARMASKSEELKAEPKFAGPRVRINEHGQMVLDEQSLVVTNEVDPNVWETVDDDLLPKKLNSLSFRKKFRTNANWSVWETDLFYEVLCATGTDFGLMNEFIPSRSRAEIKRKFNREEKLDPKRIDEVLHNPTILDETFRERVIILKQKVDVKLAEKIAAKAKVPSGRPRGRPRKIRREDDTDRDGEDGVSLASGTSRETSVQSGAATPSLSSF